MKQIKKFISSSSTILEIGDFYGGGPDEVITSLEGISKDDVLTQLRIHTSLSYYDLTLTPGDYIAYDDDTFKLIKSKYDNGND